jgi:hypothetical protein
MFPKASKKQFDSLLCYEVPAVKDTNLKAKHNVCDTFHLKRLAVKDTNLRAKHNTPLRIV